MVIGIRIKVSAEELRTQLRKMAGLCRQAAEEYRGQIDQVRRAEETVEEGFRQMSPAFRVFRRGARAADVLLADAEHCETLARGYEFKADRVADGDHELPDFVLEMMGFFDQDQPQQLPPTPDQPPAPPQDQPQPAGAQDQPQQPPAPNPAATPVQSQAPTTP